MTCVSWFYCIAIIRQDKLLSTVNSNKTEIKLLLQAMSVR